MSLTLTTRVPYGNACDVWIDAHSDPPEVAFAADPHGAPECLWFCFSLTETEPDQPHPDKVTLRLKYFGNLLGGSDPAACVPVCRTADTGWTRMRSGRAEKQPDGQCSVVWDIKYPEPSVNVAFCFPYGVPEIMQLLKKSKGYWKSDPIGVSQGGRKLVRLSNDYGSSGNEQPGIYIVARQHAGQTPGSWVLDGLLQRLAMIKKHSCLLWAVPLADIDGIQEGDGGKRPFPCDVNGAWGRPPLRHETLAIQGDIARWRQRCNPVLCLDFHAPGASHTEGIYAHIPNPETFPDIHKQTVKWTNVIKDLLSAEFAAPDFARVMDCPPRRPAPEFIRYCAAELELPAIALEIPYARIGSTVITTKKYREAGRRIADALLAKHGAMR